MKHRMFCLLAVAGMMLADSSGRAFTVIKNINSGNPPEEKLVIFDKNRKNNQVTFASTGCTTTLMADGAIQTDITGHDKMQVEINWKPHDGLGETFDATQYNFVMITCHLEGTIHRTDAISGKVSDLPLGNLYFVAALWDAKDQPVGYTNLADVTEDHKTPMATATLAIPMILFTKGSANDPQHVKGVGFEWGDTHDYLNRDMHLIVDKIALAD
jgi:hypothetical protein